MNVTYDSTFVYYVLLSIEEVTLSFCLRCGVCLLLCLPIPVRPLLFTASSLMCVLCHYSIHEGCF